MPWCAPRFLGMAGKLAHRLAAATTPDEAGALVDVEVRAALSALTQDAVTVTAAERLEEALRRARREALAPPPLLIVERMGGAARAVAGRRRTPCPAGSRPFAYQRGWLDAITDPAVRQVTVMKSARVGYTRCLDHAVGYFIHQDPSPILFVMPRIEDCEDFSRTEILPMLTDTPVLAELTGDIKTRDANQRILKRQFRNGASIAFVGANSPAGFRRITARVVLFDEVDGFPLEAGFEGDQIPLGIKRTETFWNRKIVFGSTPTLKYQSRIEKAFADSDQRYYHVPCPSCGHLPDPCDGKICAGTRRPMARTCRRRRILSANATAASLRRTTSRR